MNEGRSDRSGKEKVERGVGERDYRDVVSRLREDERKKEMRKGAVRGEDDVPPLPPLSSSGLPLDCFLSDLDVEVGKDGEHGLSREGLGQQRRHWSVNLHLDSLLHRSIREPESCRPGEMIALPPSIRPSDCINLPCHL